MTILTPTTEFEAVNQMLSVIHEAPVNTLVGEAVADVAIARQILQETSVDIQSKGWHFNTEHCYTLTPDNDGFITLPVNCITADLDPRRYWNYDVVVRGNRLYDRKNHTYTFTESLEASIVILLNFDELPQYARRYITIRAARAFSNRMIGSIEDYRITERDEVLAKVAMENAEAEQADRSVFHNYSVAHILWR